MKQLEFEDNVDFLTSIGEADLSAKYKDYSLMDAAIEATARMSTEGRAIYISNLLKLVDQAQWMTANS